MSREKSLNCNSQFSRLAPASRHFRMTHIKYATHGWIHVYTNTNPRVFLEHAWLASLASSGFLEISWNQEWDKAELKLHLIQSMFKEQSQVPSFLILFSPAQQTALFLKCRWDNDPRRSLSVYLLLGSSIRMYNLILFNLMSHALFITIIFAQWVKYTYSEHPLRNADGFIT